MEPTTQKGKAAKVAYASIFAVEAAERRELCALRDLVEIAPLDFGRRAKAERARAKAQDEMIDALSACEAALRALHERVGRVLPRPPTSAHDAWRLSLV